MNTRRSVFGARRCARSLTVAAVGVAALVAGGSGTALASSHREAPITSRFPQIDNTDVYAFVSPDKPDTVTLIANWIPFEEPNGGPNFYPWSTDAHYDINIDSNGDGRPDLTYRWTFTTHDSRDNTTFLYNNGVVNSLSDPTLLFKQTYTLQLIKHGDKGDSVTTLLTDANSAPSDTGAASMPNYAALRDQAITPLPGGGQTYAGQADDPFFLDLRVFDLLYGANLAESGHDSLAGYNVNTIALQVPTSELALGGNPARNPVIGIWSTTERQSVTIKPGTAQATGPYVQVSRLGNPLVNEVVFPAGIKDAFNSIQPDVDHTIPTAVNAVTDPEVPQLIQKLYGVPAPSIPRKDLVEIFLTGISKNSGGPIQANLNSQLLNKDVSPAGFVPSEELRLNMSVPVTAKPSRLGVLGNDLQGFPNGRRLTDDVVDIELQALEGAAQSGKIVPALAAGDGVNANDENFGSTFPYIALPHTAAVNQADGSQGAAGMPGGGVTTGAGGTAVRHAAGAPLVPISAGLAGVLLAGGALLLRRRRHSARFAAVPR